MSEYFFNRTWAEIDTDALIHNIRKVREMTDPGAKIMAVIKADAYGHGAVFCANLFLENGVDSLAVATSEEARQLRENKITAPILILGYSDIRHSEYIVSAGIQATVFSMDSAYALSRAAVRQKKDVKIHIKTDTGMGRLGYTKNSSYLEEIKEICSLPGLVPEGIFTHFANADGDEKYTRKQFLTFKNMLSDLKNSGITFKIKHACNSAGILYFPEMHMDMVRAGIVLYGLMPGEDEEMQKNFRPAMTLKTKIEQIARRDAGDCIGYGCTYETKRKSIIGSIPIGYADGYTRRLSNTAQVLVNGCRAPIVGNICMDWSMVDLTDVSPAPKRFDEAVLFGVQKKGEKEICLPTGELASQMGTISYEVTCLVGKRVARVYMSGGKIIHISHAM